jgi:curli biogenesis system outer membrane secretion channel CsgG
MAWVSTAVVGGSLIGGVMSSNAQKKAANTAASAEIYAAELQMEESRRQFDEIRALMRPYVDAGNEAMNQQRALLGLSGQGAQASAINALQNSSQFAALQQQGENAILQNAAATGGLRGGNTQGALAQFRPALLNQLIESQYSKLGGLTSIGQNAAAGVGNAGMTTTGQINQALGNMGSAQAGAALARGQANANMIGGITNAFGTLAGSGAFGSSITPSASSVANYNALGNVQFGGF